MGGMLGEGCLALWWGAGVGVAGVGGHGEFGIDQACRGAIDRSRASLFHPETGDGL